MTSEVATTSPRRTLRVGGWHLSEYEEVKQLRDLA